MEGVLLLFVMLFVLGFWGFLVVLIVCDGEDFGRDRVYVDIILD